VVLAASRGDDLDELTRDRPKCMIPIGGVPTVEKLLRHLRAEGIRDISIVRGYKSEALRPEGVTAFDNPRWQETGELGSLAVAREVIKGDVVLAYGDVIFKRYILHELLASQAPITLVVDGSRSFVETGRRSDRVRVSGPPPVGYDETEYTLVHMDAGLSDAEADGEWIGLARVRAEGAELLRAALDEILDRPGGDAQDLCAVFNHLVERVPIRVLYVQRDWIDINSLADVAKGQVG
jgi:phosphoenolpyruvate phosphomutase